MLILIDKQTKTLGRDLYIYKNQRQTQDAQLKIQWCSNLVSKQNKSKRTKDNANPNDQIPKSKSECMIICSPITNLDFIPQENDE